MSNKRITDLTELTTPTTDDVFPVVDIATNTTTKVQLGNLPVTTAVTTALATKQATLVSGTNIKTVNSTTLLGSGDIAVQPTLVSGTNIKTLNSVSLLGSGDIVLTANPSGVAGAIQFSDGSAFASDAANLFWDDTNNRLGIGTNAPASALSLVQTIALAAGATNPRIENIAYTINNTGAQTGTATGIFLNATETALNSQTHNLMDLQVGGVSKAKILNSGLLTLANSLVVGSSSAHYIQLGVGFVQRSATDGIVTFLNGAESGFTRINLGGTTSSFPAIKRNGTAIDFRLADDSGFTNISANNANLGSATIGSRLSVRGDSTNPIARFESSTGAISLAINATGDTYNLGSGGNIMYIVNQNGASSLNGKALAWYANIDTLAGFCFSFNDNNTQSYTSGSGGMLAISNAVFSSAAGSANFRPMSIQYTLNALGAQTGTATGIFINATETALNGLTHNLMDLQVGGASRFRVSNAGAISIGNTVASAVAVASTHKVTVVIGGTTYYLLASNV